MTPPEGQWEKGEVWVHQVRGSMAELKVPGEMTIFELPEWLVDRILVDHAQAQALGELEALFELQHRREMEVFERWRKEGKLDDLTWPDYGKAIEWLLEERAAAISEGQQILIEKDARTAALLAIVRRRAGSPEFQWVRDIALSVLTEDDHEMDEERVQALLDTLPRESTR